MTKAICMYSAQLHLAGGIESVVRDLYEVLPPRGIQVVCACEVGRPSWAAEGDCVVLTRIPTKRSLVWKQLIERVGIEVVVFNLVAEVDQPLVLKDVETLHSFGVKCVKMNHSSFDSPLILSGEEKLWFNTEHVARVCDAVFTVSEIDAKWWTARGFRAVKIQNPIHIPKINAEGIRRFGETGMVNLLWVGRNAEPKQPSAALAAFARVCRRTPKACLTMVGGTDAGWRSMKKLARQFGILDRVRFLPARADLSDLWNEADIHLLSSVVESFCLVLAEAKAMGIPSVMFDIPYLELTASRQGVKIVPQGDFDAMADAIVALIEDDELRHLMGLKAKQSLSSFNTDAVFADWQKALAALETGIGFVQVSDDARLIINQIAFGWGRYCRKNLWLVDLQANLRRFHLSLRLISRIVASVVFAARRIKNWGHW